MRVVAARIDRFTIPGTAPRDGARLTLTGESGMTGTGEASPLPGHSRDGDTAAAVARVLATAGWTGLRMEFGQTDDVLRELGELLATAGLDTASPAVPPSALFAAETALLDLAAREGGLSVSRLLCGGPGAGDAPPPMVPLNALLTARTGDDAARQLRAALERGIGTVKWKIGRPPFAERLEEEIAFLARLRRESGASFHLRLDVNGAWPANAARTNLEALASLEPEYVEEPSTPDAWPCLADAPVPLAADESLLDRGAWSSLIHHPACAALILKPMALGGFAVCFDLARRAAAAGKRVVVTHLMDGPVALAAAGELALALTAVAPVAACGLDRHPGLRTWPAVHVPQIGTNALMAGGWPGLGLSPDASS